MKRRLMRFLRRSSHSCVASFYLRCDWLHVQTSKWQESYWIRERCVCGLLGNGPERFLWFPGIRTGMPLLLPPVLVCSKRWARREHVGITWWATQLAARDLVESHRAHVRSWSFFCCSFTELQISFGCAPTAKQK